ncbi:MAG: hypothetical protein ACK41E_10730 [Deinococcales bacterium]
MKPAHLLGLGALALVAIAFTPLASAKNGYRLQAQEQYMLLDKDGKGAISCTYCHASPSGGSSWNKFGQAMRDLYFGDAKRNVGNMLYLVLKANMDSDGDKYSDVLEVVAKTLPGDANSKPTKTIAALEAELKTLGGVDAFKMKK